MRYRRYLREDINAVVARLPVAHSHSGAQNRPPLLKPLKYSHYGRGGLHFGQIAGEGHPHQHASTADTTAAADGSHADRL